LPPKGAAPGFYARGQISAAQPIAAPTDETPGAREAGALYFIDRSLLTWTASTAEPFRTGLRDFRAEFAAAHPSGFGVVLMEQGPRFAPQDFEHDELRYWFN